MNCFENQRADGNTTTSNINNGINYATNGVSSCIKPQEFDAMCNYKSNTPFENLQGPPSNSKIKLYWSKGWVKAPLKNCALTFTEYMSWQSMPIGSQMVTKTANIPSGDYYIGTDNGLNNPINISVGKISKMYDGNRESIRSDGQKAAVFPDMKRGLAAAMHFYIENYHGKNICQLNNKHQGYVSLDGTQIHDCIGMAALRLRWVTNNCQQMGLKPYEQLNLKDKNTLFASINSAANIENKLLFHLQFLEGAYALLPFYLRF